MIANMPTQPPIERADLEKLLQSRDKSLRWLAKESSVNVQSLINWLDGMTPHDSGAWGRIMGVVDRLRREVSDPLYPVATPEVPIPLWPWHPAGDWCSPEESVDWFEAPNFLVSKDRIATRVVGTSMQPLIEEGDYLIFQLDPAPRYGRVVLARNGDGEATVKVLRRGPVLEPLNPSHSMRSVNHWEVIGYLVAILRNFNKGRGEIILDEGGIVP